MTQSYCMDLLRQADRDRYFSILFAPPKKRFALAAIYAFNVEIARIRENIREPLAGEIRLRWWKDALRTHNEKSVTQNPVCDALLETIEAFKLPRDSFIRACDARIFDLYNDEMLTRHNLEGYCGETASVFIQLACQILDSEKASVCCDAAGHAGVAQALCGIMRLLPIKKAYQQLYIPADLMTLLGTNRSELIGQSLNQQSQQRVASAMFAWIQEHYDTFCDELALLPSTVKPAFLPVALIPAYLSALEKKGSHIFSEIVLLPRLKRQWVMTKAAISRRFPA